MPRKISGLRDPHPSPHRGSGFSGNLGHQKEPIQETVGIIHQNRNPAGKATASAACQGLSDKVPAPDLIRGDNRSWRKTAKIKGRSLSGASISVGQTLVRHHRRADRRAQKGTCQQTHDDRAEKEQPIPVEIHHQGQAAIATFKLLHLDTVWLHIHRHGPLQQAPDTPDLPDKYGCNATFWRRDQHNRSLVRANSINPNSSVNPVPISSRNARSLGGRRVTAS